jgi:hypothetical protein
MTKQQEQQEQWKITLNFEVDGQSMNCPVGIGLLREIVAYYSDIEDSSPLFEFLARHPSPGVRLYVANKEFLSEDAVMRLSEDADISVLRNLCSNDKFKRYAREDIVLQLIAKDRECAETIASNIDEFRNCDTDALIKAFLSSADPERRFFLVNNYRTPTRVLKGLCEDPDPGVASEARIALAER